MNHSFLLPSKYKWIGACLFVPSLVVALANFYLEFKFSFLDYTSQHPAGGSYLWNIKSNNFTDEVFLVSTIIGLMLMAFSKTKDEDEMIGLVRLKALSWAVLINALIIVLSTILVFDFAFFSVMAYNMCTTLILFVLRFNYELFLLRKS
jgi:hypothetical protein